MMEDLSNPEEVLTWKDRTKAHVVRHKFAYGFGAGVVVTGVTVIILRGRLAPDVVQTFNGKDNVGAVVNRSKNVKVIIKYMKKRNYPANPVRCLEDLTEWASQAEAAAAKGISETNLSQHLNGKQSSVSGWHFEWI